MSKAPTWVATNAHALPSVATTGEPMVQCPTESTPSRGFIRGGVVLCPWCGNEAGRGSEG